MKKPKILLVQLEFETWAQAKAWSYVGNFAVEDGLRANGCDCVILPALCNVPDTSPLSWLHHAKDLVAGQRFDQVWVWLVHNRYSDAFLDWVAELAPVRVGLIMESLRYGEQDYRRWPHLRERAGLVERQVRHMTHVLAADERDAEALNHAGLVHALFWPSAVPARYITPAIEPPSRREAAFYGELYGERSAWLAIPGLKDLLVHPPSAEAATEFPRLFDALHRRWTERVHAGWRPDQAALAEYVSLWRRLREGIFTNWLASLKTWSGIVNLPSLFQSYAGRVVEAMAAGRPAISWEIPDRPQTKALFRDGSEILLYPKDRPAVLAEHLARVTRDADYAGEIATAARAELLRSHTAEHRARQLLDWIRGGQERRVQRGVEVAKVHTDGRPKRMPNHADKPEVADMARAQDGPVTTVFVLTVDDPLVPTCLDALRKQEGPGVTLEVFKRVGIDTVPVTSPINDAALASGDSTPHTGTAAPHRPAESNDVHQGATPMLSFNESVPSTGPAVPQASSNEFYTNLFVKSSYWSTPHPNPDEAARWTKIAAFLEYLLRRVRQTEPERKLRMLDVGCGRGWLTNLATMYGRCEGIEPVAEVIEHARRLFPHLRFEAGSAHSVLQRPDFSPYDVVLCSEVIEHVPYEQKEAFVAELASLLKPGGFLILTTPRGEVWEQWKTIAPPNQPVEDWVTEEQLRGLFTAQGFCELGLERVHVEIPALRYIPAPTPADLKTLKLVPIYQVWACQRLEGAVAPSFTRPPMVSVIVPTFNRPDRLREALSSVLAQTYQDFEVIVVNDGTSEVDSVISSVNSGNRITCIRHDRNRGLAAGRNTGLRAAKGKYVAYLDDDDRYLPDHLETLVRFLEHSEYKVAYTDAWRVHERLENGCHIETGRDLPYSYDFNPANLLVSNYFPVLCLMHERSCIDEVGAFDEALFAHEDWDLWIRMATKFPFLHLKRTTGEYTWRTDGSSMTSGTRETYWRTMEIIYRKYRPYAERIPGVLEAQQQALEKMRASIRPQAFDCSVIIPVWNKVELTQQCLQALANVTTGPTFEVIIVDNGSNDGTAEFLQSLGGDGRIIRNPENLGFAKACNQGARAARGRYLVFLNNDTIPTEGWLNALVDEVERHPDVAVVGSKLLHEDGTIQHAGVAFSRIWFCPYHIYQGFPADAPVVNRRREFQSVTAACMLVRREVFESVGGFDEGYRNGFEDMDLCLKIGERGWRIVYQPKSVLYHLESQTPGREAHERENFNRLLARWGHKWWLPDEDTIYVPDGYAYRSVTEQQVRRGRLDRLTDPEEKRQWKIAADAQLAAQRQDLSVLKELLTRVEEWPADAHVLRWAAWVCRWIHAPYVADGFWRRVLSLNEEPDARIALARFALDQGQVEQADSHVNILLSLNAQHGEGWFLRGIIAMQRQAFDAASHAFQKALDHGGDPRKALMGQGMAAAGLGQSERAWTAFSGVLERDADDVEAIHWLLRAGTVLERWEALTEHLKRFVSRNPGDLSIRFALAGVFLRLKHWTAARQEHDSIRLLDPAFDGLNELASAIDEQESALTHHHAAR